MRALRVVGLGIDGRTVILETVAQRSGERRERFTLPADEGLHAAVRGDLPRLGQIEIELESQMRPREIQARIRAGASVEQVATAAGVPAQRIERFAYPVLLERSRTAQLAQQAHPVRADGPDVRTLEEVVGETFAKRGHDYDAVTWDSWRGENGKWVVQLRWRAGRSDNKAHWTFHPGAHGGTVTAIDDHATDLIDPQPAAQLRPVAPVTALNPVIPTTPAREARQTVPQEMWDPAARETRESAQRESREPAHREVREPAAREVREPTHREIREPAPRERPLGAPPEPAEHRDPQVADESGARAVPDDGPPYRPAERPSAERPSAERPGTERRDSPPKDATPTQPTTAAPKRTRKDRPKVPSWEDVLLGVRSPRE